MFLKNYKNIFVLYCSIFILSRIIVYFLFDIEPTFVPRGQLLELYLLRDNLIESLYFLHYQPFLWNLMHGSIAKIFSLDETVYYISFLCNFIITILIIYYTNKILTLLKFSNFTKYLTLIFVILNPNIIFYENYVPHYAHLSLLMMIQLIYFLFMNFYTKKIKYEFYSYITLLLLSFIWVLFSFITLIFLFIIFRFYEKKFNYSSLIIFLIILLISFIPHIKNKIVFNIFSAGSWTGIQLNMAANPSSECGMMGYSMSTPERKVLNKKVIDKEMELYKKKFNRDIKNRAAIELNESNLNNVGIIYRSSYCLKKSINFIRNNPDIYLKRITMFLLASHSKFAFEHDLNPKNWNINFNNNNFLKDYKRVKQLILLIYMAILYLFLIKIFFNKQSFLNKPIIMFILLFNLYVVGVSHLMAGYEAERMMYTLFFNHIFFIAYILEYYFGKKNFLNNA